MTPESRIRELTEQVLTLRRKLAESQLLLADLPPHARDAIVDILRTHRSDAEPRESHRHMEATPIQPRVSRWPAIKSALEAFRELRVPEIAEKTGIPESVVSVTLHNHRNDIDARVTAEDAFYRLADV